eukprot:jgi/Astpho2/3703/Aster-04891
MKLIAATTAALAIASGAAARSLQQAPAMAPTAAFTPAMPAITDADLLQFALQLEYLEAAFYSCATTGAPLPANVTGSTTVITEGCARGNYTEETYDVFGEIAADELNHVKLTNIVPADANSLAFMRTPQEVVAIVSGFFPLGLNGNIK